MLKPFNCGDRLIGAFGDGRDARSHSAAVDEHGASAALPFATSMFAAGEIKVVAQHAEQAAIWRRLHAAPQAVDMKLREGNHRVLDLGKVGELTERRQEMGDKSGPTDHRSFIY